MNRASRSLTVLLFVVVMIAFVPAVAQPEAKTFPFTAGEDADGARFVWWAFGTAGFRYRYVSARHLPDSGNFHPIPKGKPQVGDVAWWKEFVALYAGKDASERSNLLTALGKASLKELQAKYGPVKWYRYWKSNPPLEPPSEKLTLLDKILSELDSVLGQFPPAVKSEDELNRIKTDWERAEKEFLATSQAYSESAEIERRLGELYRLGHNMNIEEAWAKSEAHYTKALDLSPWSVSSYLGLGTLYVNSDFSYAAKAEPLFKEAIMVSYGQEFPADALSGLFFSYYYQGRMIEAITAVDKYLQLRPDDETMKRLRNLAKDNVQRDGVPDRQ